MKVTIKYEVLVANTTHQKEQKKGKKKEKICETIIDNSSFCHGVVFL